jgi:hypothetical protein
MPPGERLFLPQFSAQAVADLEDVARHGMGRLSKTILPKDKVDAASAYVQASGFVAKALRACPHVMLPVNGEIYRSNDIDRAIPGPDECESFSGFPAPVTSFEYCWSHGVDAARSQMCAPKRITLAVDFKQIMDWVDTSGQDITRFYSVVYDERRKQWALMDTVFDVAQPLEVFANEQGKWSTLARVSFVTGFDALPTKLCDKETIIGEWFADLIAVVQCLHGLRAGARLQHVRESSSSRRKKFDRKGVGGFTYHV